MFRCNHHYQGAHYLSLLKLLVPNSAADIHQQGTDNIYSHTTKLTTTMYFN